MVAYLFAGQGSQYIGMGKDLYEIFPEAKAVFDKANQVLGFDLRQMCCSGSEEAIKMTHICQPAVLTMDIAAFEAFKAHAAGVPTKVSFVAGLSLGEYAALVAAGSLEFADAIKLVRKRAELMNEAAARFPGKMAAIIGLERDKLKEICAAINDVDLANLNCPGQIVISGAKEAVDKAKESACAQGAKKAVDLEVGGAFHSRLMWEAAMEFKNFLEEQIPLRDPKVPLVCNVDAQVKTKSIQIRENLVKQIYSPVFWEDSMRLMLSQGVKNFVEFGPGRILKGLMRKIDPEAQVISIEKQEDISGFKPFS